MIVHAVTRTTHFCRFWQLGQSTTGARRTQEPRAGVCVWADGLEPRLGPAAAAVPSAIGPSCWAGCGVHTRTGSLANDPINQKYDVSADSCFTMSNPSLQAGPQEIQAGRFLTFWFWGFIFMPFKVIPAFSSVHHHGITVVLTRLICWVPSSNEPTSRCSYLSRNGKYWEMHSECGWAHSF